MKWHVMVSREWATGGVALRAYQHDAGTRKTGILKLTAEITHHDSRDVEGKPMDPSLFISQDNEADSFFHELCGALLAAGYGQRPDDEAIGELKATKAHLADFQKISFHLLKIEVPR